MATPTMVTEVRRFLGATGFYQQFIKGYAKIAKPLSNLLAGDNSKLKGERVDLSPEALVAYEELKMRCMTSPVLAFADFQKPFLLETDASKEGLGTVLSQKQEDGKYHPVAFASRVLHGGGKELSFIQIRVPSFEMGHHGAVPRVLAIRTICRPDGQQPSHISTHDTQPGCHWPKVGGGVGRLQHDHRVPERYRQQSRRHAEPSERMTR